MPGRLKATLTFQSVNPTLVGAYELFRRNLFVDALGWGLNVVDGEERDQFDDEHAIYGILTENNCVVGGFRALNAGRPYLAKTIFPQLATEREYPDWPDAWEITRFGVISGRRDLAVINYALMFRFAFYKNVRSLIAIADLTYERYLAAVGIHTLRYGAPQTFPGTPGRLPLTLVAGEIPLDQQRGPRFHRLVSALNNVEIVDETLVLRPASVSA